MIENVDDLDKGDMFILKALHGIFHTVPQRIINQTYIKALNEAKELYDDRRITNDKPSV